MKKQSEAFGVRRAEAIDEVSQMRPESEVREAEAGVKQQEKVYGDIGRTRNGNGGVDEFESGHGQCGIW